jgi:hypothetical protein
LHFFNILLALLLIVSSHAIEKESTLKIQSHVKKAKVTIDFMTPGIFSLQLIEQLRDLKSKNILIRIISDRTFEESPENLLFDSSEYFSIKIIDSKFIIPHNILIIDQKEVILGGSYFPTNHLSVDHIVSIKKKTEVHKIYQSFQSTWQKIKLSKTRESLLRFQHYIDINSSENKLDSSTDKESNFVASKNGTKYYRTSSNSSHRIANKNRIYFQTEDEAKESGRTRARNF